MRPMCILFYTKYPEMYLLYLLTIIIVAVYQPQL